MTKRATFTQAELERAWKVARRYGAVVEVERGTIRLLPPEAASQIQNEKNEDNTCDIVFSRES